MKREENVIFAGRMFKAIPTAMYIHDLYDKGKITMNQLSTYMTTAEGVIDGVIEIEWKEGVPHVRELTQKEMNND